eukprot:SAG11_NODE_13070_length_670_cov_2.837413_1_plen_127_part_01
MTTKMAAGAELLRASDGLAPARCGGLMVSLFIPRLAALGAGRGTNTTAAVEQEFTAAGAALRGAHERMGACRGRQALFEGSGSSAGGVAPGTLIPGVAADRRSPWHARRGGCEVARSAARAAFVEAD